jgi:hypothetical protein
MITGRNDPCPCGSGKKYKKCCWSSDQAARLRALETKETPELAETDTQEEYDEPESILKPIAREDTRPAPEIDPLLERINAFWQQFMDAPYAKQWSLVTEMLAEEPELCDGEMVFEITNTLFGQAVTAGELERFRQLLDQLEQTVPEAYAEELHYILEWRIQMALTEGDEVGLEHYFYQFSPLAGDHIDTYYRVISMLTYHGKLEILYQGLRQARSYVAEGGDLVPWAYTEFTDKLSNLALIYLVNRDPNLTPEDTTLQQHLAEYDMTIVPEEMATLLDYYTGRKMPDRDVADFVLSKGKKQKLTKDNYTYLMAAFTHYAHHEKGVPLTKSEMVGEQLFRYFTRRHEGELDEIEDDNGRRPQRRRKRKPKKDVSQHPLCPEARTLDRFMAQLMGIFAFQHYEALALFELMPTWLSFLHKYDLLEGETQQQTVQALSYLKGDLLQIADKQLSDPAIKENLMDWPYDLLDC